MCGFEILKAADLLAAYTAVQTVTRRVFDYSSPKVTQTVEADASKYPEIIAASKADTLFSGLATTRALAGLAEAFVAVDYGINYEVAKAAKAAGVHTYVLISSVGANAQSRFLYLKTKGQLEDAVLDLKFPKTIILRPGALLGPRTEAKGFLTDLSASVFKFLHNTKIGDAIASPIYGSEIGQIAVNLAQEREDGVHIVGSKELVQMLKKLPKA